MTEVCLVQMPYAAVERPSLALGILKSSLSKIGIPCKTLFPNLWFAEEVGLEMYQGVNSFTFNTLLGEWTFAGAAFPDAEADADAYFSLDVVQRELWSGNKREVLLVRSPKGDTVIDAFRYLRKKALPFVDRVARRILDERPALVGCTSTFQQHCASLALLRRIRELDPSVVTLIGGANCEGPMGVATHRSFPWVDFAVSGEADLLFPVLVRKILEQGRDVAQDELPYGVIGPRVREKPELLGEQPPRVVLHRMDEVAVPDFDEYFEEVESSSLRPYMRHGLPIETARGCWWGAKSHCTFCGLNGDGMGFRSKSPERVVGEFEHLSERYGIHDFNVVDNILDMRYLKSVIPNFAAREEPFYAFYETKSNLKRSQVEQLAAAGIRYVQPGIESLHQGPLDLIGKGCTPMVNLQLLKWALEYGVLIEWLFLFGFPGEKDGWYADLATWIPKFVHLNTPGSIATVQFHRFSPYHFRAEEFGLELEPEKPYPFVYPLSDEELRDFAYYFDDHRRREEFIDGVLSDDRPGMKAFQAAVVEWRASWIRATLSKNARRPVLDFRATEAGGWVVTDTRKCSVAAEQRLDPLEARVMEAADIAITPRKLVARVSKTTGREYSWERLEPVARGLVERHLLFELEGQYLGLAVPAERPPLPGYFPGGYIDLDRYLRDQIREAAATNRAPIPLEVREEPAQASVRAH
ncbi:MAG: RiPP maturation radical SAM C-methyltransferase [Holophagales bacterium]|nr:RiPP maturation radical SAM C-methyltransferase [Holophagales bacterium]